MQGNKISHVIEIALWHNYIGGMARQSKDNVEPITKAELIKAQARIGYIAASIASVADELKDGETLYVSYLKSLNRGLERLEAVEPQLRRSLAMHRAGSPLMPAPQVSTQADKLAAAKAAVQGKARVVSKAEADEAERQAAEDEAMLKDALSPPNRTPVGRKPKAAKPSAADVKKMANSPAKGTKKAKRG
ncbi:MAG: hypothetical protein ACO1RT_13225 [Planctomycetaceae bacterium]